MFPMLRVALRIQDLLILLAIGCVLLGIVYLMDLLRAELKKGGVEKTNFTPWHAPQFHFLMMALMVGVSGVFAPAGQTLDVQLYSTYFVISLPVLGVVVASYLLFVSFVYFMARRLSLMKWMTVLHLIMTAVVGLGLYLYQQNQPDFTRPFSFETMDTMMFWHKTLDLCSLGLVFGQLLLPVNLLIGLWRRG